MATTQKTKECEKMFTLEWFKKSNSKNATVT